MQISNLQQLNSKCQYIQTIIQQLQYNFNLISNQEKYQKVTFQKKQQKILNRISNKYNHQVQNLIQKAKIYDQTCQQINNQLQQILNKKQLLIKDIDQLNIFIRKNKLLAKKNSRKLSDIQSLQNQIIKEHLLINQQMKHYNLLIDQTSQIQSAIHRLQDKQKQIQIQKQLIKIYERDHQQYYTLSQKYQKLRNQKNHLINLINYIQKGFQGQANLKLQQLNQRQEKANDINNYLQELNKKTLKQSQVVSEIKRRQRHSFILSNQKNIQEQQQQQISEQIIKLRRQTPSSIQKALSPLSIHIQNHNKNRLKGKIVPNFFVNKSFQNQKKQKNKWLSKRNSLANSKIFYERPYERKQFSLNKLDNQQKITIGLIRNKVKQRQEEIKNQMEIEKDEVNILPSTLSKKQESQLKSKFGYLDIESLHDKSQSLNDSKLKNFLNNSISKPINENKKQFVLPTIHPSKIINKTQNQNQRIKNISRKKTIRDRNGNRTFIGSIQPNYKQKLKNNQSQLNIKQKKKHNSCKNSIRHRTEGIVGVFEGLIQKQNDNLQYEQRVNSAINQFKSLISLQNSNKIFIQDNQSVKATPFTSGSQSTISRKKHGLNVSKGINLQRQSDDQKQDGNILVTISQYYQKQEGSIQQSQNKKIYIS